MAKRAALNSGDLRHIIVFETPAQTALGRAGEPVVTWTVIGRAYAAVTNSPGREYYQQGPNYPSTVGQIRSEQILRFSCRYDEVRQITPICRIKFEGKTYNITDIREDHKNLAMTLIEARLVE